jgi:glycosyltransferase involved in cell wall biosynthesis
VRRAVAGRYDAVHSHEEGGLIGVAIAALLRLPHLYDMHSSLPQQLSNFAFTRSSIVRRVFDAMERVMVRRSRVVIVVCPTLEDTVRAIDPQAAPILIENAMGGGEESATAEEAAQVRRSFGFQNATPLIVYTGTFEKYQGLDLLFDAIAIVRRHVPDAKLLMAGGQPDQIAAARERAATAGASDIVVFAGEQPAKAIPAYLLAADVLVSPRSRGSNTPLKIYQYLRSGRPIVATRLLTHTQVLSDETAVLTGATAEEFAAGILRVLNDPVQAVALGRRAHELAETKYSHQAYVERTRRAYDALAAVPSAAAKDLV